MKNILNTASRKTEFFYMSFYNTSDFTVYITISNGFHELLKLSANSYFENAMLLIWFFIYFFNLKDFYI